MPVSFKELITEDPRFTGNYEIVDEKTVYADDSVAIIQFSARLKEQSGALRRFDYRYVYLMDFFMSHVDSRPVFNEVFQDVPCMPDDLIAECRKTVRKSKESVYKSLIGMTHEVRNNFDSKTIDNLSH